MLLRLYVALSLSCSFVFVFPAAKKERSWKHTFEDEKTDKHQAAGGIISASLLSMPGASGFYKGGLTLYTLESRIAFGMSLPEFSLPICLEIFSLFVPGMS